MKRSEARIIIAKIIRKDDMPPNFGQLKLAEKILEAMDKIVIKRAWEPE